MKSIVIINLKYTYVGNSVCLSGYYETVNKGNSDLKPHKSYIRQFIWDRDLAKYACFPLHG